MPSASPVPILDCMASVGGHAAPKREDYSDVREFLRAHDAYHDARQPTELQVLERAVRLVSNAVYAVELQLRRIRDVEPEDDEFLFRKWMDIQFLISALWRIRLAAMAAKKRIPNDVLIATAIERFDLQLPYLKSMRDVGQHLDDYATDSQKRRARHVPDGARLVGRRQLEVGAWSEDQFYWLGMTLDFGKARLAGMELYGALQAARSRHRGTPDLPEQPDE